ncbi:MAG: LysE family translocator [Cellvibrionales bacterium]|nr:LysE family translocator [Cellvibrionales bacterium]
MEFSLAFILFTLSMSITPGPNNVMLMASGLNFGVNKSLPHLFGVCLGFPSMFILVGLGLGVVFEQYPIIHDVIKVLGIVYLIYLAWQIAHAKKTSLKGKVSSPFTFIQAALFQWVNPKAWVMASTSIAVYTSVTGNMFYQVLSLAVIFVFTGLCCCSLWLFLGHGLKRLLKSDAHRMLFNTVMAILLVASVFPAIYEMGSRLLV